MTHSEIYHKALRIIKENLGKVLFTMFCYTIILGIATSLIGSVGYSLFKNSALNIITLLCGYVASVFFSAGLTSFFLKLSRDEDAQMEELISPKKNIMGLIIPMVEEGLLICAVTVVTLLITAFAFVGSAFSLSSAKGAEIVGITMLIDSVVVAIISLGYSMIPFIYLDGPERAGSNTLSESWNLMKGNKLKLFLLLLGIIAIVFVVYLSIFLLASASPVVATILLIAVTIILVILLGPFFTLCLCIFYDSLKPRETIEVKKEDIIDKSEEEEIKTIVEEMENETQKDDTKQE